MTDLWLRPARGLPSGLRVPATELTERYSRSSGPGGQSVNTTDSRVELSWDIGTSSAVTEAQRAQLLERLGARVHDGVLTIAASEHRSQLHNRTAARARLASLLAGALAPPPPARRATRPSRAARQRRVDDKRHRGELKAGRGRRSWE